MSNTYEEAMLATHQADLELELLGAGLSSEIHQVLGKTYCFAAEQGSHEFTLVGTVIAIELSDEGGLQFYVTNLVFGESD